MQQSIEKVHLKELVTFTINNIPNIHTETLEKFLELVYATGNYGTITIEQVLAKMERLVKHIPNTCIHSLFVLVDLLEIPSERLLVCSGFSPSVELIGREIPRLCYTRNDMGGLSVNRSALP